MQESGLLAEKLWHLCTFRCMFWTCSFSCSDQQQTEIFAARILPTTLTIIFSLFRKRTYGVASCCRNRLVSVSDRSVALYIEASYLIYEGLRGLYHRHAVIWHTSGWPKIYTNYHKSPCCCCCGRRRKDRLLFAICQLTRKLGRSRECLGHSSEAGLLAAKSVLSLCS